MSLLEAPLRRAASARRALVAAAVVVTVLLAIALDHGAAPAAPTPADAVPSASVSALDARDGAKDFPEFPSDCGPKGAAKICRITYFANRPFLVLWGDSHALEYRAPVESLARSRKVNLVVIFAGGCPLSLPFPASSGVPKRFCDKHNLGALDYVRRMQASGRGVRVILSSWWHFYRIQHAKMVREERTGQDAGLTPYERHIARLGATRSRAMFAAIGRSGIPADVIAQSGSVPGHPPTCLAGEEPYSCDLDRSQALPNGPSNKTWLARLSTELAGPPRLIDPSPVYCGPTRCRGMVGSAHTYYDRAHLGMQLTQTMRSYFAPSFDALAAQR